jgi:hypothetical protein
MILALCWLTISTPFVYSSQQVKTESSKSQDSKDNSNPFSNTTEEKNETGVNTLSEYLHEVDQMEDISVSLVKFYKCHPSDLYFAFHPELISPPPEV